MFFKIIKALVESALKLLIQGMKLYSLQEPCARPLCLLCLLTVVMFVPLLLFQISRVSNMMLQHKNLMLQSFFLSFFLLELIKKWYALIVFLKMYLAKNLYGLLWLTPSNKICLHKSHSTMGIPQESPENEMQWYVVASLLTVLTSSSSQGILTTLSQSNGGYKYDYATIPFLAEIFKLLVSSIFLWRECCSLRGSSPICSGCHRFIGCWNNYKSG
ncbi:hypothetical protein L6452_33267 [Arctium lappa]|uniref:Uncharacterized protein n=1 Tax=Arctium lappa TaxID=4217 RepID=A0ACB8Z792_ARCLA|nr:hypothetical protein L6452_33267 [Arctium lappa]